MESLMPWDRLCLSFILWTCILVLNPDLGFQTTLTLPEWMLREPVGRSWGQSAGQLPLPPFLDSREWKPECPGILGSRHPFKTGNKNVRCAFSSWGHVREQNEAGGRGERLVEGLESRLPRDTSKEAHPFPSSLSFLCEGRPGAHSQITQLVPGSHRCSLVCLLRGSLLTQQDGLHVGRYPCKELHSLLLTLCG